MHNLYKGTDDLAADRKRAISRFSFLTGILTSDRECVSPQKVQRMYETDLNLCDESDSCEGSLRLPRSQMPQLSGSVKQSFVQSQHRVLETQINPHHITPVQGEINAAKVVQILDQMHTGEFNPCEKSILVALDNTSDRTKPYVLDGHHRWVACQKAGGMQKVIGIFGDLKDILSQMLSFPGSKRATLDEALTILSSSVRGF